MAPEHRDSDDDAMAECFNSLFTWELIYPQGPWKEFEDVEIATWATFRTVGDWA